MNLDTTAVAGWLLRTAAGGGLLLLIAWALMTRTRQPALRQRLGEIGLAAALVVPLLSLAPRWLVLPWPSATTVETAVTLEFATAAVVNEELVAGPPAALPPAPLREAIV